MRQLGRILVLLSIAALWSLLTFSQDGQSLGDIARKKREQSQQKDAADGHAAKSPKVFSDQTTSGHPADPAQSTSDDPQKKSSGSNPASPPAKGDKQSAEQWKEKILAQKNQISSMQAEIDRINASIHMAPGNCVSGCVQWNERQVEKQQQVEQLRGKLDEQKKQLEEMQDSARRQGYGTAVYDP
jgi:hypothetical protein